MTFSAWLSLAVIGGVVWGGFLFALITAIRSESRKDV
jgi:hypothetical protein